MRIVNLSIELADEQYAALEHRAARLGKTLNGDWTVNKEIEFAAAAAVHSMAEEEIQREIRAIENAQMEYITDDTPIRVVAAHKEVGGKSTLSEDPKGEPEAEQQPGTQEEKPAQPPAAGGRLTKSGGVYMGPSGKETWYNLPMGGVIKIMRDHGYSEEEYPYSIREDGCKMLGAYIMIAANLDLRPRGSIVETSLGPGIVCDTGSFCKEDTTAIDLAVDW